MKNNTLISVIFATAILLSSCKKEGVLNNVSAKTEWMKVLADTVTLGTDDDLYLGQNGKVVTDNLDNIYLYYYKKESKRTTVMKCDVNGILVWKKTIEAFSPGDMVLLNDGSIVISGNDPDHIYQWFKYYAFRPGGGIDSLFTTPALFSSSPEWYVLNSTMYALPDNSIIVSGITHAWYSSSSPYSFLGSFMKINSALQVEWKRALIPGSFSYEKLNQNSIIPTSYNQFLFEFALTTDKNYVDSSYFGLITGLLNSDGTIDTVYKNVSGYTVTSSGNKSGVQNRYCNRLMNDGTGNYTYHYSSPVLLGNSFPPSPAGFYQIGNDAKVKNTIPVSLPSGYRIISCTQNQGRFLLTAYKTGVADGTNDFSANQTLFLTGGSDWHTSTTFTFQDFYSDFFPSSAPTRDGGFIIMGKIQSFNGPSNKLVLIKWKG